MTLGSAESVKHFGVPGTPTVFVRDHQNLRVARIIRRYRGEIESLNSRQLAKRYQLYLRWCDRVQAHFDFTSSWPSLGGLAQATRRLYAAHQLLKERGLHVPEREEAWAGVRSIEIYGGNEDLHVSLRCMKGEELQGELERVEEALMRDPASRKLSQRQMLLWGEIERRQREAQAVAGGAIAEISPVQARLLRERIVQQMTRHLGYRYTHTEAHLTLAAVGIEVLTPPPHLISPGND